MIRTLFGEPDWTWVILLLSLILASGGSGCGEAGDGDGGGSSPDPVHESCTRTAGPGESAEETTKNLERVFVPAEEGDVICMREGEYQVKRELNVTVNDIVIRGAGQSKTILDFSAQNEGANGILVQGTKNFAAIDFTVKNSASDALKTKGVDGVVMRNITVTWDRGASEKNGAYALYPVESQNVLIEGCRVSYARDAGVYLGQSETAVIRDNEAFGNVVGIEVENTFRAEVYDNYAHNNTNGFLIINLPDLMVKGGAKNLIYNNRIEENNHENFGADETTVSEMPAGSGLLLVSGDNDEVRDNEIKDNKSVGIGMVNHKLLEPGGSTDDAFDPYPEGNWVHDNTLVNNGTDPQDKAVIAETDGKAPQVFWDGVYDDSKDNSDGSLTNCFAKNVDGDGKVVEPTILDVTSDCPEKEGSSTPSYCEVQCNGSTVDEVELPERVRTMVSTETK